MYTFIRDASPACLALRWEEWTDRYCSGDKGFKWYSPKCYENVRQKLFESSLQHCAFCDGLTGAESRQTIEHFKPKERHAFPELAFHWANLYPCCDRCQSQKGSRYDPALINPDDLEYHFDDYFVANYLTGEIEVSPLASAENCHRAHVTLELYGLNLGIRTARRKREAQLFQHRNPETEPLDDFSYRYFLKNC